MRLALPTVLAFLALTSPAWADPCEAVPEHGPTPSYLSPGSTFSGPVPYIGDGDSMCVAVGPTPREWVEVRLADFYAPELNDPGGREAKAALQRIVRGQEATCTAEGRSYDRVVAYCSVAGVSVGERMRRAGIAEGGRGR